MYPNGSIAQPWRYEVLFPVDLGNKANAHMKTGGHKVEIPPQIVVITGASSGIGLTCAEMFHARGHQVVGVARRQQTVEWKTVQADVRDRQALLALAEYLKREWGRVDVLVNSAGISNGTDTGNTSDDEWRNILDVNLMGVFRTVETLLPLLRKSDAASIVNIGSAAGQRSGRFSSASYAASKGGVITLSRSLARALAEDGIRVNCINPGFIDTPMTAHWSEQRRQAACNEVPLGRFGSAAEVAEAVAFLASKQASYITGTHLDVNGGLHMD